MTFEDTDRYNFSLDQPVALTDFVEFSVKSKQVEGVPLDTSSEVKNNGTSSEEDAIFFEVGRHFTSLGSRRFQKNTRTAAQLNKLVRYYNRLEKFDKSSMFGRAALGLTRFFHACSAMVLINLVESLFSSSMAAGNVNDSAAFECFEAAKRVLTFHWGSTHPILMTVNDKMAQLYTRADLVDRAFEYHQESTTMALKILGRNHPATAGYIVKAGHLFRSLEQNDKAILTYQQALACYEHLEPRNEEAISACYFYLAETLKVKGDDEAALQYSLKAKELREKTLGSTDPLTIESYYQVAQIAVHESLSENELVMTRTLKRCLELALECYDKIFRYLKTTRDKDRDEIMRLTRVMCRLKFRLLSWEHRNVLISTQKAIDPVAGFDPEFSKDVILRLVHLSPVAYIDEIFGRIDSRDSLARAELKCVLQLTTSEAAVSVNSVF